METTMTSRQKQALMTQNKIFDTAIRLLEKEGFEKLTIRKICKEAEVSLGTFYLYFNSKQDILLYVYKETDELFVQIDIEKLREQPFIERVVEVINVQLGICKGLSIETMKQIYIQHMQSDNEYFLSEERSFFKVLKQVIEEGQIAKEINEKEDAHAITWSILKFVRGIIFDWLIHDGDYDIDTVAIDDLRKYMYYYMNNK